MGRSLTLVAVVAVLTGALFQVAQDPSGYIVAKVTINDEDTYGRYRAGFAAILRQYVEKRFGVRAPERTTQEFLEEASSAPALAAQRSLLEDFLRQADAVKFARERPASDEARAARDAVRGFIDATRAGATAARVGGTA